MKKSVRALIWILFIAQLAFIPGCNGKQAGNEGDVHQGGADHENHAPQSITLTPEAMAAADIETAPALKRNVGQRISAPGELEFNSRRMLHLTARTAGRIERTLAVAGDRVSQGQLLAEIYSPDYMSKQAEFLQAAARADRLNGSHDEAGLARAFRESARERLILLGASPTELAELAKHRVPRPLLPVRAHFAATVIESAAHAGDQIEIGASLFSLADLSVLWARLYIQEKDLAAVRAGSAAEIRTQAYPGEIFQGKLLLVGDMLDAQTRTVIGRVEVPNPRGRLKTGMYIEASLAAAKERAALVVPEAALQDDDGRPIVFVETRAGVFAKRVIEIGERFPGLIEIRAGLAEGEKVVTSGSFLLKSELNKGSLEDEHGHS